MDHSPNPSSWLLPAFSSLRLPFLPFLPLGPRFLVSCCPGDAWIAALESSVISREGTCAFFC